MTELYAPKSAAKIDEAASLIEKAVRLLDNAGDSFVIAEIEKIKGTEFLEQAMVRELRALADKLDDGPSITGRRA